MVDYNNETTITRPAIDVERISVLQRRDNFISIYEQYMAYKYQKADVGFKPRVIASLFSLFLQLQGYLKRAMKEKDYKDLVTKLTKGSISDDEILNTFESFSIKLDDMRLTKLDIHKSIDRTRVVEANKFVQE
jgi:hypothetical protein